MSKQRSFVVLVGLFSAAFMLGVGTNIFQPQWSDAELKRIQSLSLASLPALKSDPSNRVSDDLAAAALGKALFFETKLSANGKISCASCHIPSQQFQDGLPVSQGMGVGARRTMPIAGSAYFPFLFWDGRKDSQWSQALGPLENPLEHGADRTMVVQTVVGSYKSQYEKLFGAVPNVEGLPDHAMPGGSPELVAAWNGMAADQQKDVNLAYANIGKAIAAFERTIEPQQTRFDQYAAALAAGDQTRANTILNERERSGLKLFIGQGNCVTCHGGPLLTDNAFHNLGFPGASFATDNGRSTAVAKLQGDEFNCLGPFSDASASDCAELKFMETSGPNLIGAFRSPTLRGVAQRAPFTHAGQFSTLQAVLKHYNDAPSATLGRSELKPLGLNDQQLKDIEMFLRALDPISSAEAEAGP